MAQYRELASFAQFGSDLDEATKMQLDLGSRTTEVMKQAQYTPMAVEHQVAIIYAVTNGYLNDVAVEKVAAFEVEFHKFMDTQSSDVMDALRTSRELTPETEEKLKAAIALFKQGYLTA
jgi:F-type H+-transporting ATPase subunit alpha